MKKFLDWFGAFTGIVFFLTSVVFTLWMLHESRVSGTGASYGNDAVQFTVDRTK